MAPSSKLKLAKIFTIVLGIILVFITTYLTSVLGAIMTIFSIYMPMMIPIIILSILKKTHRWQSAIVSMIAGPLTFILWEYLGFESLTSTFVGIMMGFLFYYLSDIIMAKKSEK